MRDDTPPELFRDDADEAPVRSTRARRILRVVVVIGLVALVLPAVLGTLSVQMSTADAACAVVVSTHDREAVASRSRFELFGPIGPGWYCYSVRFGGLETLLSSLGLIPGLTARTAGAGA